MASDLITTALPSAGIGVVGMYAVQAVNAWWKGRNEREQRRENIDVALEKHRDDLTFQLLTAAREEVAAARAEASESRAMQLRFAHFDEALEHIELLISAKTGGEAAWVQAQRRAEQFLTRMKRWKDAAGTLRNEAQVQQVRDRQGDSNGLASIIKDI